MEKYLLTCGERILCLRCTARGKRSGEQCGRPALKSSRTAKCKLHGGRSTGPRTPEGKARIAAAHTLSGEYTRESIEKTDQQRALVRVLADAAHVLKLTDGPKTRGRKPKRYQLVESQEDILLALAELEHHM